MKIDVKTSNKRKRPSGKIQYSFTYGTVSKWDKYELEVNKNELRKAVQIAKGIG